MHVELARLPLHVGVVRVAIAGEVSEDRGEHRMREAGPEPPVRRVEVQRAVVLMDPELSAGNVEVHGVDASVVGEVGDDQSPVAPDRRRPGDGDRRAEAGARAVVQPHLQRAGLQIVIDHIRAVIAIHIADERFGARAAVRGAARPAGADIEGAAAGVAMDREVAARHVAIDVIGPRIAVEVGDEDFPARVGGADHAEAIVVARRGEGAVAVVQANPVLRGALEVFGDIGPVIAGEIADGAIAARRQRRRRRAVLRDREGPAATVKVPLRGDAEGFGSTV
jgi:hypothetical protein